MQWFAGITPAKCHIISLLLMLASIGCGSSKEPGGGATTDGNGFSKASPSGSLLMVDSLDKVGGNATHSPFDAREDLEIPFELRTNDLPSQVIGIIPAAGMQGGESMPESYIFGRGRYVSVRDDNGDSSIMDTYSNRLASVPYRVLKGGVSEDARFFVSAYGVHSSKDYQDTGFSDPFIYFGDHSSFRTLSGSYPYAAEFSSNGQLVAIGFGGPNSLHGICIFDVRSREVMQIINTGCFPVHFADGDRYFSCFTSEGAVLTYERDDSAGYRGISRSEGIFPPGCGKDGFLSCSEFGDGFLITTRLHVPENEPYPDGQSIVSIFRVDGPQVERVAEDVYAAVFEGPHAVVGSRFALFGYEGGEFPVEGTRWLCYGDGHTKKLAFLSLPWDMMFVGLDVSGRYAFFTRSQVRDRLFVVRLAKDSS